MKQIKVIAFLSALALASCTGKNYEYRIDGTVKTKDGTRSAIWYTDTILYSHDTAVIVNSNGTVWKIEPPYTINRLVHKK
jgi:hypothetical protein